MSDAFADLGGLLDHVWQRLAQAAEDAEDPYRHPALATFGEAGPEIRTVALRRAERTVSELEVHSDLRTAKVRALRTDPRAALLFWDPATRMQLRVGLDMSVMVGAADRWATIPLEARGNYGTDPAPGTAVERPELVTRTAERGRFAALVGLVRYLDVLSLAHDPHRRARFTPGAATWIAP